MYVISGQFDIRSIPHHVSYIDTREVQESAGYYRELGRHHQGRVHAPDEGGGLRQGDA